jgi:outer membrane protein
MKTFLTSLTTLCILFVFSLDSLAEGPQISKGSIFVGTTTNLMGSADDAVHLGGANTAGLSLGSTWYKNGSESEKDKYTRWNLTPIVGYYIIDGLAAGLQINIRGQSSRGEENKSKFSTTTIGPWVRYYAAQYALMGGKLIPFAEGKAGWGSYKDKYTSGSSTYTDKESVSVYTVGPGLALFITDHISIDMLVAYKRVIWSWEDDGETSKYHDSVFGFSFGLSFFIPPIW